MRKPNHAPRESVTLGTPRTTAEDRVDPRQQFARIEGFAQIIVCPAVEPGDAVVILTQRGEHQNGGIAVPAQPLACAQPVFTGHHHVQHDEVETRLCTLAIHLSRVPRDGGTHPIAFKIARQRRPDFGVVVDDKDMRLLGHTLPMYIRDRNRLPLPVCHHL